MKKIFSTFLGRVAMGLAILIVPNVNAWGEKVTSYSGIVSGTKYYIGATTGSADYYLSVDGSSTSASIAGTAVTSTATATPFTFTGSGTSWTIQFESGNYLSLKSSKDNGKVQVVESSATFTASDQTGKLRLSIGDYSIQKNNSGTQFGSYSNTQTDIWLEAVPTGSTCATPTFSVAEGTYYGTQSVELSCGTAGATIYYTTDGTTPTSSSTAYSSAIAVSSTTTIKAIAVKADYDDSEVASAAYTIKSPVTGYVVDFEEGLAAYSDWTFTNAEQGTGTITAHGGTYYATTGGKSTAIFQTKAKVAYPNVFTCYVSKTSTNTTSSSWKIQVSSDGSSWTDIAEQSATSMEKGTWVEFTGNIKSAGYSDVYVRLYYGSSTALRAVDDISLTTYTPSSIASPTFSVAGGTYKAAQSVTLSAEAGTTIYYTTDGSVPTSGSNEYTAAINVSENMTIKAIASKDGEDSEISTATYVILNIAAGTEADPYTVADAYTAIDAGVFLENVYAAGTVSEIVTAYDSTYGNITYNISSDGSTSGAQLQAYRGKSYNGDNFTSDDDIQVGDEVVVYGTLTKYGSTYEFAAGNQLVSLNRPVIPLIVVSTASLSSFTYEVGSGPSTTKTFTVSGSNLSEDITLTVSGSDYEISLSASSGYASSLVLEQEEGSVETTMVYARLKTGLTAADYNATITLTSTGATNKSVTLSGSVTVPSLAYTVLPFSFDGGRSDIDSEDGLTQSGLDSDYSSSPKLKFKSADDCLILHFNEAPGTLTFDIKGNGSGSDSWAGTFKVQVSSDGSSYEDIATYTALAATDTKTFDDLATSVRYIKWIYVTKTTGNVALGNIGLTKASAPETIELTGTLGGGQYWVSFFSDSRYTLSEGAKAFTMNSSYQLYQLGTDGSVIPANTAVILISDTAAITLTKSDDDSAIAVNGGANILQGSTSPVAKYTISGTPYVLGVYGGELGFYEFTGDGIPAGKAYYEE